MSVWGIGAYYKDTTGDQANEFLITGQAYIGWKKSEAPALYCMLNSIKAGDIIYIKSFVPKTKEIRVKAVGIVTATNTCTSKDDDNCISVKWKKEFEPFSVKLTEKMYKNNVFNNTLYEEFNENIVLQIIEKILD